MIENIEDLPIRPGFGTLRNVMRGIALHAKSLPSDEWSSLQPPSALAHLHRPARLLAIWEQIMALLRSPVATCRLPDGNMAFNILGSAVIVRGDTGELRPYLWWQASLDHPELDEPAHAMVVLHGMPWRWIWLDKLLGLAQMEYQAELEFLHFEFTPEELRAYFTWVSRIFRQRITRHADMRQVRRRIANALQLDDTALRRAFCGVPHGRLQVYVSVLDYNQALRLQSQLDQLEIDAPHLLPLYMVLGTAYRFPEDGEPVQRLKTYLLAQGFKERDWRYIVKCNRRLMLPMRYVYDGGNTVAEILDYLRIMCALELREQLPEPLANTLFAAWGNPAQRSDSFWETYCVHRCYPHIMQLAVARYGTVDFDVLQTELLLIIRWAWDIGLRLTKEQRQQGWLWLLRMARDHLAMLDAKERGASLTWSVPAQTHTIGAYQLRFLTSSYDLWEEAKAMRHCVNSYVEKCRTTNDRIASVTRNQRRIATAMFDWSGDELKLTQIAGKANQPVPVAISNTLRELHIDGASAQFEKIEPDVLHICRRLRPVEEQVEEMFRPPRPTNLPNPKQKENATMTALVTNTGSFIREVAIKPVQALPDTFQIEFSSRLLTAKNPAESRKNFALVLDREGLLELKATIERSLT